MTPLLELAVTRSAYGPVPVLHDVAMTVGRGEIVAVLGGNGAGKTTLLRTISGVLVRATASVVLDGEELSGAPASRRVTAGLVHVPEGRRVFTELTVSENLLVPVYAAGRRPGEVQDEIARVFDLFSILRERARQRAGGLSGGQQQMLAVGRALMARPRVLMVDEASLGLAPNIVDELFGTFAMLRADGLAILLVEQNVRSSLEIADRAYVLERGTVALTGDASTLAEDERVQATYLGGQVASAVTE